MCSAYICTETCVKFILVYFPDSSFLRYQHSVRSAHHSAQLGGSNSGSNFIYSPEAGGIGNSRSWFTYEELAIATNSFAPNNLLGEGGFGCVYKGVMPDGREVAVKQLKAGGGQGEREFRAEVEIISRIHHRHLVSLVGYCISEYQRILVYDYVPNNSLHYHLHGKNYINKFRFLLYSGFQFFVDTSPSNTHKNDINWV